MASLANDALIESWRLSLHDKRPRTVHLYVSEVQRFERWLAESERSDDLLAVTRRDAEAYISSLREAGLTGATIRSRWISLRSFYGWATDEAEITENPMAKVKVGKPPPPPVEVLADAQLRALFKACEGTAFNDRRDLAIFRLMAATGARLSEIADLAVGDVDLTNRLIVIRDGKGGKARAVRFDPATAAAMDRYKRSRARHALAATSWWWLGSRGRLTRKGIPGLLAKRAEEAGIGHVHPHMLRHTWSHRWLEAGGNEGDLQRLGGWESAEIMRRYGASRAVDRALAAYDTVNPMEGL